MPAVRRLAAAFAVLLSACSGEARESLRTQVTVGQPAPAYATRTLQGDSASIAALRGDVVLLNIWATWCAPCREEMPSIQALHERFADDGLRVVAVSIDQPGFERTIVEFARELALTFEILHDATGRIQRAYQTTGVPETFVIGRDGVILRKQIGHADWNSPGNRALIAQMLGVDDDPLLRPEPGLPRGDTVPATPVPLGSARSRAQGTR